MKPRIVRGAQMIYTMVVLFVFSLVLLIRKYSSMHSLMLMLLICFLDIALFGVILYIAKCGNYYYPKQWIFMLDYKGYLMLSKINISFYNSIRMQNIGFAGFLGCLPFFLLERRRRFDPQDKKRFLIKNAWVMILPILYIIVHDPITRTRMYFFLYRFRLGSAHQYESLFWYINAFDNLWIVLYMLFPIFRLIMVYRRTNVSVKKRQILSLIVSLSMLNLFCSYIFLWGPFRQGYDNIGINAMLGFPTQQAVPDYYYNLLPVLAVIIGNVMLIILLKFSGLDNLDFFRDHIIAKNAGSSNKNIRGVLHSFKNIMFSIKVLTEQMKAAKTEEEREYLLERINAISSNSLEHISVALNSFKGADVYSSKNNISHCIDNAITRMDFGDRISVNRNYGKDIFAFCDSSCLEEVFVNILSNSKEAISLIQRERGIIDIRVDVEYEWVIIKIKDNGNGISKKNINKIFKSFYTTKSTNENWGVGLNCVYKNIKAMKGFVQVQSTEGKYTIVTIMLQRA